MIPGCVPSTSYRTIVEQDLIVLTILSLSGLLTQFQNIGWHVVQKAYVKCSKFIQMMMNVMPYDAAQTEKWKVGRNRAMLQFGLGQI